MIYCLLTCDLHISAKQMTGSTVRDKSGLAWYEKELEDFEPQQEETLDLEEEDESRSQFCLYLTTL